MVPMGGSVPYRMLLMAWRQGSEAPDPEGHQPTVGFDSTPGREVCNEVDMDPYTPLHTLEGNKACN